MSSTIRGSARAVGEATCNGIVRRMVNLPRNILGGVSRVMNHGKDLIGIGGRNHNHNHYPQIAHPQHPSNLPYHDQIHEEWAFLATFEQQYGTLHPFFYACQFVDVLKIARDEQKFVFMYIHSPEHPFTPSFCRETLCSEVAVQFLDTNFVCWGGLASRGDGLRMAAALRASRFPFCVVVVPAAGDNLVVLQQTEGPVSPADLLEILQRTIEEQGPAFRSDRTKQEEDKRHADCRLREEQDVAYIQALHIDQEKEGPKKNANPDEAQKPKETTLIKQHNKAKPNTVSAETCHKADKKGQVSQILIRFPNGERREHSFLSTDKIEAIFEYIDDSVPGLGSYRLISNFPKKVYGIDQKAIKLKDAGLHPKASLFLEPI